MYDQLAIHKKNLDEEEKSRISDIKAATARKDNI